MLNSDKCSWETHVPRVNFIANMAACLIKAACLKRCHSCFIINYGLIVFVIHVLSFKILFHLTKIDIMIYEPSIIHKLRPFYTRGEGFEIFNREEGI